MILTEREACGMLKARPPDVCVIGGGAAGLTLAARIARHGDTVCVLESGGVYLPGPSDLNACNTEGAAYSSPRTGRPRILGGASSVWTGWTRPLDPQDFSRRDNEWPISFADLEPFLIQAQRELLVPSDALPQAFDEHREDLSLAAFWMSGCRLGDQHRPLLATSPNAHLVPRCNVIALEPKSSGGERLTGASIAAAMAIGPQGDVMRIPARSFVLAAGGIESARILLASKTSLRLPIGVGCHFMEHPHVFVGLLSDVDEATLPAGLAAESATREGARLRWVLMPPRDPAGYASDLAGGFSILIEPMAQAWDDFPWRNRLLDDPGLAGVDLDSAYAVIVRAEQAPHPDNRLILAKAADVHSVCTPTLSWCLRPPDVEMLTAGLRALRPALERFGRLIIDPLFTADPRRLAKGGHHHMGMTRMGIGPRDGVVDEAARVFGVDNLWIAGPSIFRTGGFANPMHTTVALALRLADSLCQTVTT